MKTILRATVTVIVLGIALLAACAPREAAAPPAEPATGPVPVVKEARGGWEAEWQKTVQAAKAEGRVSVYVQWGSDARTALARGFKDKFGIDVEFTAVGKGAEIPLKIENERRAGLYLADVVGCGATTMLIDMKPKGFLTSIEPMLILPEATDASKWLGGKFPYVDKDKMVVGMVAGYTVFVTRNTDLVKDGEVKSYYDLLEPKWKGKIVMNDPTVAGTANSWVFLMNKLWGTEKMKDYLRQLIKQEPAMNRDLRLQAEWLARGKNAVGLALYGDNVSEFKKHGAPVDFVRTVEGGHVSTAAGTLAVPSKQLSHPNAAKVFANWILTKEGQALLSPGIHRPSARTDVGAEGLEDFLAKAGDPITREDEDDILKKDQLSGVAKEVLAPLFR